MILPLPPLSEGCSLSTKICPYCMLGTAQCACKEMRASGVFLRKVLQAKSAFNSITIEFILLCQCDTSHKDRMTSTLYECRQ